MASGMESWIKARDMFLRDAQAVLYRAANEAGDLLLDEMKRLASLVDHDLEQLRRMGHPYGWGKGRMPNVPHDDWRVHNQSGTLYGGLGRRPVSILNRQIETEIGSTAKHTWFVLLGTRLMRPRDFVTAAMIIQEQAINRVFESALKTLMDRTTGGGYRVRKVGLPHEEFPAQLPK